MWVFSTSFFETSIFRGSRADRLIKKNLGGSGENSLYPHSQSNGEKYA